MGDIEPDAFTVSAVRRIADVPAAEWDACIPSPDPFLRHAFLAALEDSGCATARTGWAPQHLIVERGGRLVGAMPLYLKSHSLGEYVFDHAWAHAFERAGGRYYPKLQAAVPFTPVTGPRLLVRAGAPRESVREALVAGALEVAKQTGASSLHVTFPTEDEADYLGGIGFLRRTGEQFHWENQGYGTFDDFLGQLAARKRKAIKRERREAVAAGVEIVMLSGAELTDEHWDAFFTFYMDTGGRKWGRPYLNREFFRRLHAALAADVVLILARRAGRWIAGALNLVGGDTLYGRYWGCLETHPFLHFECCYYRAIEYAIARGLKRVEAGAQGEHKLARGYLPVTTHSAHWIADPNFRRAVERYLEQEREAVAEGIAELAAHGPYRKSEPVEPD